MVQRRSSGGGAMAGKTNPFDSDDDSPAKNSSAAGAAPSSYKNPFDDEVLVKPHKSKSAEMVKDYSNPFDDDDEPVKAAHQRNPFDDEGMWNKHSSSRSKAGAISSPPDHTPAAVDSSEKPRRRDKVKEKLASVSDDIASKASQGIDYVRPRSKNLMGSSQQTNARQLLLEVDDNSTKNNFRSGEKKIAHSRIEKAFKAGDSMEGESVQELEEYGVHKAEETTAAAYHALKMAEEIKESATNTAMMLHDQGQQITRTHETAVHIDVELSRGEKLLGSLGGLFSKTWKPKKSRNITGPMLSRGDSFKRKAYGMEQRAALGLTKSTSPRARSSAGGSSGDASGSQFQSRVKNEFAKQDDALADLSNVLDQLKEMSVDMGTEIRRQTDALDHVESDVTELGDRVRGANERGRRLLGR